MTARRKALTANFAVRKRSFFFLVDSTGPRTAGTCSRRQCSRAARSLYRVHYTLVPRGKKDVFRQEAKNAGEVQLPADDGPFELVLVADGVQGVQAEYLLTEGAVDVFGILDLPAEFDGPFQMTPDQRSAPLLDDSVPFLVIKEPQRPVIGRLHDFIARHPPCFVIQRKLPARHEHGPAVLLEGPGEKPVAVPFGVLEYRAAGVDERPKRGNLGEDPSLSPVPPVPPQEISAVLYGFND